MPQNAVALRLLGIIGTRIQDAVITAIEQAQQSDQKRELVLFIDSPGGSPEIGIDLYEKLTNACKSGALSLTTYNLRGTESSAVCIYCAGQTRWCNDGASFLLHEAAFDPFTGRRWTASRIVDELIPQLEREIPKLKRLTARFVEIIAATMSKPQDCVARMLADETSLPCMYAIRDGLSHKAGINGLIPSDIPTCGMPYDDLQ